MAMIIRTDGTDSELKTFKLADLQEAVGGYIEGVQIGNATMYVNEDGKAQQLPFNQRATALLRAHYPETQDIILGNVVLLTEAESNAESA